jgi:hypothetical protein
MDAPTSHQRIKNQVKPLVEVKQSVFAFAAKMVFFSSAGYAVLIGLTQWLAKSSWPQLVYLDMFHRFIPGIVTVVLTPSPLFSPLPSIVWFTFMPLIIHLLALMSLAPLIQSWNLKSRLLYFIFACLPVVGPLAAYSLMHSWGELD